MKSTVAVVTLLCLAVLVLSLSFVNPAPARTAAAEDPPNSLGAKEKSAGWRLLFDGRSTAGWRNYGKQDISPKWKVVDGALAMEERGAGDIITADQFEWFELSIEYRISTGGNSGIMFRVTEGDRAPYYSGPEIQVQDNQNAKDPQLSGWLYQLYQPADDPKTGKPLDATKPAGEWNRLRIIVAPDKCETFMNGVKYYEYRIGSPDWNERVAQSKFKAWAQFGKAQRGHIALQDHGNPVAFRSIKIREIPAR